MDATASSRSVMRLMGSALPVTATLSALVKTVFKPLRAGMGCAPVAVMGTGSASL